MGDREARGGKNLAEIGLADRGAAEAMCKAQTGTACFIQLSQPRRRAHLVRSIIDTPCPVSPLSLVSVLPARAICLVLRLCAML